MFIYIKNKCFKIFILIDVGNSNCDLRHYVYDDGYI